MTALAPFYQRVSMDRLRKLAATEDEGQDEAARAYVQRVLSMEVQRREDPEFQHLGCAPISPTANIGMQPGGADAAREPLASAYDKGIRVHAAHEHARRFIEAARIPDRQLLAVLIQAAKLNPALGCDHVWSKGYDYIANRLGFYAQLLGWPPGVEMVTVESMVEVPVKRQAQGIHEAEIVPRTRRTRVVEQKPLFCNGQAIRFAACQGRAELLALAKAGVV
ncbi:hypothetical protein ACFQH5_20330 [Halomonas salifodinae]|uniref:Uncharacterized protein n=1 Tax=Halomonas salifodinae TaxID=438745 RepID=A0ABW2F146_9GAMM